MRPDLGLVSKAAFFLYAAGLHLYPRRYRVEFGDEMQAVYYRMMQDALQRGKLVAISHSLREFGSLPYGAFQEHLRQRRLHGSDLVSAAGRPWRAALAALVPFLVLGILPNLLEYIPLKLPQWLQVALAILLIEILLGTLLIGLVKRLPDWSLPYWGFIAAILSLLFFNATIEWVYRPGNGLLDPYGPWLPRVLFNQGYIWFGLLFIAVLVALLSATLPPLRPFHFRLRADWTLLSFGLYGASLLAALFTFDEYRFDEPYKVATALILSAGAWAYLSSRSVRRRALVLAGGMLLAGTFTIVAQAWLYPLQAWSAGSSFGIENEIVHSMALWGWLMLVVLSPALLNLLPSGSSPPTATA